MTLPLETKLLIKETVKETIEETFLHFGVDASTPEGVLDLQKDWHHLRASRLNNEGVRNKTSQHVVNVIVSGIVAAAVLGAARILGIGQ